MASMIYLVTVDYVDDSMSVKTACDLVELADEDCASDIKDTIRLVMDIQRGTPIKIISMCPMPHLTLGDE